MSSEKVEGRVRETETEREREDGAKVGGRGRGGERKRRLGHGQQEEDRNLDETEGYFIGSEFFVCSFFLHEPVDLEPWSEQVAILHLLLHPLLFLLPLPPHFHVLSSS